MSRESRSDFSFERFVLPNNLTVLSYHVPHVQSVFMRVDLKTGSAFEGKSEKGLSHFVEHFVHQGNKQYKTSQEFRSAFEKEGIFQNGATHNFGSYYYVKSPRIKFEKAFKLLYLLVTQPVFPQDRLQNIREVILNEYHDYWQQPENKFFQAMLLKRFSDHPSYLDDALGEKELITSFTGKDSQNWFDRFYHAGNFILTVVGNYDKNVFEKLISETYTKLPKTSKINFPTMTSGHYSKLLIHHQQEDRDQITFQISSPLWGLQEETLQQKLTRGLLTGIIGSGRFSRLFQVVREKYNLVYWISCSSAMYRNRGYLIISGQTTKTNLPKAFSLIFHELKKIHKDGVKQNEISVGKNIFESATVFEIETPEGIGQYLVDKEFWNLPIDRPEYVIQQSERITKNEINTLARKLITFQNMNIGLFGNLSREEVKTIENLVKSV